MDLENVKKLNIGSGKKYHEGYICIDIELMNHPDIVGDFRTMNFDDLDEILAEHLLEHFSREESEKVLNLWNSWLRPGGILIVETPDFEGICRDFNKDKYWMTRHAYGSQEANWAYHLDGWYEDKFIEMLPKYGFEIIKIEMRKSRHILPNIRVTAKKVK